MVNVLFHPVEVRSCDEHWPVFYKHYFTGKKRTNVNLGQTIDRWTHVDKKTGRTLKHKLTTGKDWELSNRILSKDDGVTPINRLTGQPAQY